MMVLDCNTKHAISLKPDSILLDGRDLILLSELPKPLPLVYSPENRPFLLECSAIGSSTGQKFVNGYFDRTILPHTNNTVIPEQCSSDGEFVHPLIIV